MRSRKPEWDAGEWFAQASAAERAWLRRQRRERLRVALEVGLVFAWWFVMGGLVGWMLGKRF
ncbi:MAG: hypothetical protein K6U87_09835 [Firmicutes bacterium]|nr:hypothetical protein [Bacillota bacterium]